MGDSARLQGCAKPLERCQDTCGGALGMGGWAQLCLQDPRQRHRMGQCTQVQEPGQLLQLRTRLSWQALGVGGQSQLPVLICLRHFSCRTPLAGVQLSLLVTSLCLLASDVGVCVCMARRVSSCPTCRSHTHNVGVGSFHVYGYGSVLQPLGGHQGADELLV